ncbi:MAG: HD domain-containing protein [Patescibacteria group bacterium]|nr:HD domain-containing protein [Patescibacteria group bacterium]
MRLFKNLFEPIARPNELKPAEREKNLEEIKINYGPVLDLLKGQYDQDVAAKPEMKNQRLNLDTHNQIVLDYADELIKAHDLSQADKAAAYLAVIFHDSGKLAAGLMEHHLKSKEYAEKLLDKLGPIKQGGEIIEITPELKEKVLQAIERHMNHPFLVNLNKGRRFPEPENETDKIVFDADMMANVGFKNVCFRLINEGYMKEDAAAAYKKGITALEESFNNVMAGVKVLGEVVLSEPAKKQTKKLAEDAVEIFNYLKANRIFQEIQDKYSENNEFNSKTINQKGGVPALKKELNAAIIKAAQALNIDRKIAENFIM